MTAALSVTDLCVHYGGVVALADVSLEIQPGTLGALIGPNGAGKTTFVDAVSGFTASTGLVVLGGEDISRLSPHLRSRRGLARTFQTGALCADLTVSENLTVAVSRPTPRRTLREVCSGRLEARPEVDHALWLLGIEPLAARYPHELTQGQRKLVGVARAIAPRPAVVLLDEPAAGLDPTESRELGDHLRRVVDEGVPVLLVDHDMDLVLRVSDHVVVLDFGQVISCGTPKAVARDPRVVQAYLGHAGTNLVLA
jgi:branched-chain amino acid transport system ATP-binding protein